MILSFFQLMQIPADKNTIDKIVFVMFAIVIIRNTKPSPTFSSAAFICIVQI